MAGGNVFFIADMHFGDKSIIDIEGRQFSTVQEMDETIINNWNKTVYKGDTIFILGDLTAYDKFKTSEIIKKLNGEKILVMGNHDTQTPQWYRECGFSQVIEYPVVYDNFWMLSHEPLYVNNNSPYANIFGHVHNNPMYKTVSTRSYCVSAERIGYTPISFNDIQRAIKECKD